MKNQILLLLFILFFTAARSQYWQQKVDYKMEVTLNDKEHSLEAFEKITYTNNSPDTLHYIWFHLWPNAFKNDKTAFSEQRLENGKTDFYFSKKEERGYINRLDFKVGGITAKTEDHPQYIDVIKLILPTPLLPGQQFVITTPFHTQLSSLFAHSGYKDGTCQVTQWYPKPAVYDAKGWHPMPLLDQGDFYSELGDYEVTINFPQNLIVAATGKLQDSEELKSLQRNEPIKKALVPKKITTKNTSLKKPKIIATPTIDVPQKSLHYKQKDIHDFAFFASKDYITQYDTCQLASGKIIDLYTFYKPKNAMTWQGALNNLKEAIRLRSQWIGDYPYDVLQVVEGAKKDIDGMEYPILAVVSGIADKQVLDEAIAHEAGHNWFYGAIASNERDHPWMDEGINSYYDLRYHQYKYGQKGSIKIGKQGYDYKAIGNLLVNSLAEEKKDQPIETASADFSPLNYYAIGYYKTAAWLLSLQDSLGTEAFDAAIKNYYQQWKFKHPQPENFKEAFVPYAKEKTENYLSLLNKKGSLSLPQKKTKAAFLLSQKSIKNYIDQPSQNLLLFSPLVGYNNYDKLMVGAIISNYKLPLNKFNFLLAPLYATNSHQLNGLADLAYHWHPEGNIQKASIGLAAQRFSKKQSADSLGNKVFEQFYKIVPSASIVLKQKPRSTLRQKLEWKTYIIGEKDFSHFVQKSTDSLFYVDSTKMNHRYLNQLSFIQQNYRALYPYDYTLQLQQSKDFYRINFTANYFFNYAKGGGLSIRAFAAKFGYLHSGNIANSSRYMPKLLGVTGEEDYTYSNYFLGRTASYANSDATIANKGLAAQQIMIRDGGFKLRTDQFEFLQGRSENWVAALNFNTTLPKKLFPFKVPLKLFLDVGTYSEAWDKDEVGNRLQYVAGLQLSLFKNTVNIYAPLLYSPVYRDNLKTFPELNTFAKRLTFSIDLQHINPRSMVGKDLPF